MNPENFDRPTFAESDGMLRLESAALCADWEQVRLNGGPPCFHIEDGEFCFRAQRWPGHPTYHKFLTLHDAIRAAKGDSNG
jgi:hypothetical protein